MSDVRITAGPFGLTARWEREKSPETCEAFEKLLPYRQKLIHVRWSGEGCWIPMGDFELGVGYENHTSPPSVGDVLFYPGGYSETEIIIAYGVMARWRPRGRASIRVRSTPWQPSRSCRTAPWCRLA